MPERVEVAICLPAYGSMDPLAAVNQAQMAMTTVSQGVTASMQMVRVPAVDVARNELVDRALDVNATHLMWIDSDVAPPPDAVLRLLHWGRNVVSGLYHYKLPPYNPVAYEFGEGDGFGSRGFRHLTRLDPSPSPTKVDGVGMGCVLVKASVYRKFRDFYGDDEPFYNMDYPRVGEDVWFFRHLQALGVQTFLDTSVRCLHLFTQAISTEDWRREVEKVDPALENWTDHVG